jgi:hypothetical protein
MGQFLAELAIPLIGGMFVASMFAPFPGKEAIDRWRFNRQLDREYGRGERRTNKMWRRRR